jgi:ABC-type phosphate transport system substrate-binding protein
MINKRLCALTLGLGMAISAWPNMASAAVVAVVSSRSGVSSLSENEVTDIFLGKLNRFPGGEMVSPIDLPEGSEVRDEFYLKFSGKSQAQLKAHWSKVIFTGRGKPPKRVANSAEVKKLLAENPNAIGYIDPADVDSSVKVISIRP